MTGAIAALVGIGPKDELEGMMGAQLIASHSAAMECYRRAMIGEQTFVGRQENLNQANKLSRTFTMLLDPQRHMFLVEAVGEFLDGGGPSVGVPLGGRVIDAVRGEGFSACERTAKFGPGAPGGRTL